nr:cytochrome c oxidase subunit II [Ceratosolen fusciceps]
MSLWGQMSFQEANSPIMEYMCIFHDFVMIFTILIMVVTMYLTFGVISNKFMDLSFVHGDFLEFIWTILPFILLFFLAFPSLQLLYLTENDTDYLMTIKVIGHQWYWSYEYSDYMKKSFDSYMISNFKNKELFRLLDVDNYLVVPINVPIRFLVSAVDVIHSFTIPSLGMKVDAVPGRINQTGAIIRRVGVYFGQCSEICGVNHSFMPIGMEAVDIKNFYNWLINVD